jgi:hypothetical protein
MQIVPIQCTASYIAHTCACVPALNLLEYELISLQLPHIQAINGRSYKVGSE